MFKIIYCDLVECKVPDDIIFLIFEYLTCASIDCNEYGNKELVEKDVESIFYDEKNEFNVGYFYCPLHYQKILDTIENTHYYYEYCCDEYEDYGSDGICERW